MFLEKTWRAMHKPVLPTGSTAFACTATLGSQILVRSQVSCDPLKNMEDNHMPKYKSATPLRTAAGEPLARCKNPQIVLLQRIKWVFASLEAPTSRYSLENRSKFCYFPMLMWGHCDLIYMPRQGTTCWLRGTSEESAFREIMYCFWSFNNLIFSREVNTYGLMQWKA